MFNLEKAERAVAIFLITALLAGLGVAAYKKPHSSINLKIQNFQMDQNGAKDVSDDFLRSEEKININEAGIGELMKLKGVGRVLAGNIEDYRSNRGAFASVDDIKNVKGIGAALFNKIKDDITVE